MTLGGVATGILAESQMGRPTKIEGNPDHPASLGATDVFAQAAVLSLYDPDRSQHRHPRRAHRELERIPASGVRRARGTARQARRGTAHFDRDASLRRRWQHKSSHCSRSFRKPGGISTNLLGRDAAREGAKLAFGEYVNAVYRVDRAQVILALDADFLCAGPGCVRYARDFARGRRDPQSTGTMNRLYAVESTPLNTGAMADHRLRLRAGEIESLCARCSRNSWA